MFVDGILRPTAASAAAILRGEQVYLHLSCVFLLKAPGNAVIILVPGTAWQDSPQDKLSEVRVILPAAVKAADIFRPMPASIYTGLLLKFHISSLGQLISSRTA